MLWTKQGSPNHNYPFQQYSQKYPPTERVFRWTQDNRINITSLIGYIILICRREDHYDGHTW